MTKSRETLVWRVEYKRLKPVKRGAMNSGHMLVKMGAAETAEAAMAFVRTAFDDKVRPVSATADTMENIRRIEAEELQAHRKEVAGRRRHRWIL